MDRSLSNGEGEKDLASGVAFPGLPSDGAQLVEGCMRFASVTCEAGAQAADDEYSMDSV